jgi:FtsZ-binding cell division protein ZapB
VDGTAVAAVIAAAGTLASGAGAGYAAVRARSAERSQGVHETLKLSLDARAEDIVRLRAEMKETRDEVRSLRQEVRDCHRDRAALSDANDLLQDKVAELQRTVGNGRT